MMDTTSAEAVCTAIVFIFSYEICNSIRYTTSYLIPSPCGCADTMMCVLSALKNNVQ